MRILFVTSQWPSEDNPANGSFVKREVEALRQAGVAVDVFLYQGGWSFGKYARAISQLRQQIRSSDYDLIHVRFGQAGLVGRAQTKLPVVITYGGSDVEGSPEFYGLNRYRNYVLIGVSRLLSLLVDEVIVVSCHLGRKLPRRQYHVIPSGIDLNLFHPYDAQEARLSLGLSIKGKLILFAGNPLKKTKRYDLARDACEIAGSLVSLELIVLQAQPQEIVPLYMSACDALLLTSTNEGSPNVVKEALACNLPVVTVDVGDVRKRLGDNPNCVIVSDDNPESIAEGIIQILNQKQRPELRYLVQDLQKDVWVNKVLEVYKKVLSEKSPKSRGI